MPKYKTIIRQFEALSIIMTHAGDAIITDLGSSGITILKRAGKSAVKNLLPNLPRHVDTDEAMTALTEKLKYWDITATAKQLSQKSYELRIRNCPVNKFNMNNKNMGQTPFCFFIMGMAEQSHMEMTGRRCRVSQCSYDEKKDICCERFDILD